MALDLKKLRGLFIESPEEGATETHTAGASPAPSAKTTVQAGTPSNSDGLFDQKIFDSLAKALEDKNLPGEDYLEFAMALKAMANIPMDETIKIQSVLATLSTKGLSVGKILESAEHYMTVLEDEKNKFNDALKHQVTDNVEKRYSEITAFEELNKAKAAQIEKLTNEIAANQQQVLTLQSGINEANMKIRNTEANFLKTFDFIVGQIRSNLSKIKSIK